MKTRAVNKRSNAYFAGKAHTQKACHMLKDNPYRDGTRQWHEWQAGFKDAVAAFIFETTKKSQ